MGLKKDTQLERPDQRKELSTKGAKWKRVQKVFRRMSLYGRCNGAEEIRHYTEPVSQHQENRVASGLTGSLQEYCP